MSGTIGCLPPVRTPAGVQQDLGAAVHPCRCWHSYRAGRPQADAHDETGVAGLSDGVVAASSFRTAYVPLSSQDDFISGLTVHFSSVCTLVLPLQPVPRMLCCTCVQLCSRLWSACCQQAVREFAAQLRKQLGLDVYTFSVFHVFFEQYLGIRGTAIRLLGASISTATLVSPLIGWRCAAASMGTPPQAAPRLAHPGAGSHGFHLPGHSPPAVPSCRRRPGGRLCGRVAAAGQRLGRRPHDGGHRLHAGAATRPTP